MAGEADPRRPVAIASLLTVAAVCLLHWMHGADYVGGDNDDTMRLVQVRDLLAGQGWFDPTQYRLGLEGGTPMHWSRLIDAPLALLIAFFAPFFGPQGAEAAGLFVWPLALIVPLFAGLGLAGRNFGDRDGMHVALFFGMFFVVTQNRFHPGAIDHHNAQLALMALTLAGLTGPRPGRAGGVLAGAGAAMMLVIGAETAPAVAAVCAAVAVLWAVLGQPAGRFARAFALAFAAALTACFFALTPPAGYGIVVCDAFSSGFYRLGTLGGAVLFAMAALFSNAAPGVRLAALAAGGAIVAGGALAIAPGCLGNPLAGLDPMLRAMWLNHVNEARSVLSQWQHSPENLTAFYAVPLVALVVCAVQARRGEKRWRHGVFAAVIAVSFVISLVQLRGAPFANLAAIPPLAGLVGELRRRYRADGRGGPQMLAYVGLAVISLQFVWALAGVLAVKGSDGVESRAELAREDAGKCSRAEHLAAAGREAAGVVSAVSNIGPAILRHTPHRALSGPYHRNQEGMLTQLRIAMAGDTRAEELIRRAGVTLVAFCVNDPEAVRIAEDFPESLYAGLMAERVPAFLLPVADGSGQPLRLYRVAPLKRVGRPVIPL